jgi:uncharacterized protein (DUF433 family)
LVFGIFQGQRYSPRAVSDLPPVRIPHPHVIVDDAIAEGSPVVEGTKVPVRRLFSWHRQGTTVETLLRRYPQLGPARIFDALAFAYDNLDLMTADLVREREALARETESVSEPPPRSIKERVAEAKAAQEALPFKRER